jgi:hypothetical protein
MQTSLPLIFMETKEAIKKLAERNISTEQFQKIISALRGPDSVEGDGKNCDLLKQYTTARIRAIVVPGYYGDVSKFPLTKMEMEIRDTMLAFAPEHFQSHYKEAVKAIKQVFFYDLKTEEEFLSCDKPKGSCKVDDSNGSRSGTDGGQAGSWLRNFQPIKTKERITPEGLLVPETVQLLERTGVCNKAVGEHEVGDIE